MIGRRLFALVLTCTLLALTGCKKEDNKAEGSEEGSHPKSQDVSLNGAGATFPYPLYSKWMSEYYKQNPNVKINYQSIGSGGGIRQIIAGTVDFGATDAAMKEEEAKKAPGTLYHIPTTIGAVVLTFNVDGVQSLKLSSDVIADIFLGKIKKWNDARIKADNEGVALPDENIAIVHRSDGSGTTAVFTDYVAKVSPEWEKQVGVGKSVKWPTGLGAKGNEGVTGQVKTTPGSIGYVELAYATQNKLPTVAVKNAAGHFVEPKIAAITAAASGVEMPDSLHVSLANPQGEKAYPIAAYTYILVYEDAKQAQKGEALARFLWWAVHDGQKYSQDLHYAPLPEDVVKKVEARLKQLKANGKPILSDT